MTAREAIQLGYAAIGTGMSILEKIHAVARVVEKAGYGDTVTTRMIRSQLIMTGRA